jgi:23S rRNA (uracil1939-C5)-methyltransferase
MDLALARSGKRVVAGLHRRGGQEIINIAPCQVLDPRLVTLAGELEDALPGLGLLRREGSALVTLTDSGFDLLLRTDAEPDARARSALAGFAARAGVARISWAQGKGAPETLCLLRPPVVRFSGVAVEPPPGAFLQASEAGQAAIIAAVLAGVPAKRQLKARMFDLYAGCGAISFALAELGPVQAVEGDAASLASLRKAAGGGRVVAEQRDLARRPMMAAELKNASVVVLDPPHAGAAEQMAQIAASGVPAVIYVSCHPASLARDVAMLAGRYDVAAATPIDQFLWSARLESVVVLRQRK